MIYLLRHGSDDENYIGGHSDVELTKEGIIQAKDIAKYLSGQNYKIDRIISSDIRRAKHTADIVNQELKLPIIYTSLLRELDKGDLTGMPVDLANVKYPDFINLQDINKSYPNGESMTDFYLRIKNDIDKILSLDNSLLVTHRGVINMIYFILNDIKVNMDKKQFDVTHASLHELNPQSKTIKKIR